MKYFITAFAAGLFLLAAAANSQEISSRGISSVADEGMESAANLLTLDVAPISLNIPDDTSYASGTSNFTMFPEVVVANLGTNTVTTSFQVVMTVSPGGYVASFTIPYLTAGFTFPVTFDELTITLGEPMTITVYTTLIDSNRANDTIRRYSTVLPGADRKVLLEEWTSSTCVPCAANNPTIVAFVDDNWDNIVATKYHVGWPAPGNDPMYLHNPTQSYDRRFYYNVNTAPHVIIDGVVDPVYPYSTPGSLDNAYASRPTGSPMEITVTSQRTAVDSIRAEVTVNIVAPMMAGNYFLRVQAIERMLEYTGTNLEPYHYDVFRKSFPNSTGTALPTALGSYMFTFNYRIDPVWQDTMVYTIAFIQNDLTKEIANAGKSGRTYYVLDVGSDDGRLYRFALEQNYPNPFNPTTMITYQVATDARVVLKIYNALGQQVRTLVDVREVAGVKTVAWDGLDDRGIRVGTGIYLYRLEAGGQSFTKKMLLIK